MSMAEAEKLAAGGQWQQAEIAFRAHLAKKPRDAVAMSRLADALDAQGRYEEAVSWLDRILQLEPRDAGTLNNKASALNELQRREEALAVFDQALRLEPANPIFLNNKANVLNNEGRYAEALMLLTEAVLRGTGPVDSAYAHLRRGVALAGLGRYAEAADCNRQAAALAPAIPEIHYALSAFKLLQGNYAEGWQDYESRWQQPLFQRNAHRLEIPRWQGQRLTGSLLITQEQGLGDQIQFARYALLLAKQGHQVVFEASPALINLFNQGLRHKNLRFLPHVPGNRAIQAQSGAAAYIPLMSLPGHFQTRLDTVLGQPYLHLPHHVLARGRDILTIPSRRRWPLLSRQKQRTLRIGLVWAGSPEHRRDKERSMPAPLLAPLLAAFPDIAFYALQKGATAGALTAPNLVGLDPVLQDFTDTAGVIMNLDLVITVDTSVAHLAGALGKPVWILLAQPPEWRWLLDRADSPWYPTARLFRQPVAGAWKNVVDAVAAALKTFT